MPPVALWFHSVRTHNNWVGAGRKLQNWFQWPWLANSIIFVNDLCFFPQKINCHRIPKMRKHHDRMFRHNLIGAGGYLLGTSSWSLPWELEDDILPARRTRACQMQSHAFLIASSRFLLLCRWASQSSGSAHKYKYISTYIYKVGLFALPSLSLSLSVPSSLVLHTFVEFLEACCFFLDFLFCVKHGLFSPIAQSTVSSDCLFSAGQVKKGQLPRMKTGAEWRLKRWQSWRSTKWPRKIWPRFWRLPGSLFAFGLFKPYGYGSIPINTIFRGMNIHLPAILMFTRGTRFWHTAILISYVQWTKLEKLQGYSRL